MRCKNLTKGSMTISLQQTRVVASKATKTARIPTRKNNQKRNGVRFYESSMFTFLILTECL